MQSISYLSAFIVITGLCISIVSADFCSEQTNPETIFSIGENVFINSEDNKLWLLKRNKTGYSVFTEVNIEETFGERFRRVFHGLLINPLISCDYICKDKIQNLVIVIGRDKQNKLIYSTFKLIDGVRLIKRFGDPVWGLMPDGDFGSNSNPFWGNINSSVEINDFFYTPQTVFLTKVTDPNTTLYKCIDRNGSVYNDWKINTRPMNFGGKSSFRYGRYLYGIKRLDNNEVVINDYYNITTSVDNCANQGYSGFSHADAGSDIFERNIRKMFGCKPRNLSLSISTESSKSSEYSLSTNPSEKPESTESTTKRTELSSNTTLIIVLLMILKS